MTSKAHLFSGADGHTRAEEQLAVTVRVVRVSHHVHAALVLMDVGHKPVTEHAPLTVA